ncbi:YvcK family protein [Patescibacteria group bacterium]|nr:YvcK family protein [Patescibacteria group bacterium]
MAFQKTKKVVVIGGGTGVFTVISGLRKYPLDLTAIVSMADDGGSTGVLREEFGILPPGDVRRVLVAMSRTDDRLMSDLFNYRFAEGGLKGHSFGNIMLTALERITGSFETAVDEAAHMLGASGTVVPVTLTNTRLCAGLEDGTLVRGETNIDVPKHDPAKKIKKIFLEPSARANPKAVLAIGAADMIVIGPGDLYSSIIPNIIVSGIAQAIKKSKAKKAYVVNLMTKWGETNHFSAEDFVGTLEQYLGKGVLHYAMVNNKKPSQERLKQYAEEHAEFVGSAGVLKKPIFVFGDFLRRKGFLRHDPARLAQALVSLI